MSTETWHSWWETPRPPALKFRFWGNVDCSFSVVVTPLSVFQYYLKNACRDLQPFWISQFAFLFARIARHTKRRQSTSPCKSVFLQLILLIQTNVDGLKFHRWTDEPNLSPVKISPMNQPYQMLTNMCRIFTGYRRNIFLQDFCVFDYFDTSWTRAGGHGLMGNSRKCFLYQWVHPTSSLAQGLTARAATKRTLQRRRNEQPNSGHCHLLRCKREDELFADRWNTPGIHFLGTKALHNKKLIGNDRRIFF